jgi:NTP pyrophosphatase (non-canonical NTP hydrolase)
MPGVRSGSSLRQFQEFVGIVYKKPNDLHFDLKDMLSNIQRFAMRGLKGIRKGDPEKAKKNFLISLSWFMSTMNRLHIDIENALWNRFPYLCSYCASCPCECGDSKTYRADILKIDDDKKPSTLKGFQDMFEEIYPASGRTLNKAGIHMAEEIGELSEAILGFRGSRRGEDFESVVLEAADLMSHFFCVFNSLGMDLEAELAGMFTENCHVCKKAPCECQFSDIMKYES